MGALQIDTISVVARSPYFVLFSRLGEYDPKWLDELLVEKALFEQWAHAACFVPIEDFALVRRRILEGQRESYFGSWAEENKGTLDHVLEIVAPTVRCARRTLKVRRAPADGGIGRSKKQPSNTGLPAAN